MSPLLAAFLFALTPATADLRFSVFPKLNSVQDSGKDWGFNLARVAAPRELENEAKLLTGILEDDGVALSSTAGEFKLSLNQGLTDIGNEGYRLTTSKGSAQLTARTPAGIFNGIQSVRQLLKKSPTGVTLPCGQVTDSPRFPWRGMMLDTSRHFFPKADILKLIDSLSRYKINTFHWHLNDDGGWRIEIKRYPNLTARGAWRLPKDGRFPEYSGLDFPPAGSDTGLYGGFYTQEEIKEIVRFAESRNVNIVPEIEMPGHNLAATLSYPELICSPKLKDDWRKDSSFLFPNIYCPAKESTYIFLENVLDEVMALFPSKVIHIGGDEVDKFLWNRCEDCQALMKVKGMTSAAQLESHFIQRIERYLNDHGRQIIGWDEILEGGLAPNAKVMSWRGIDGGVQAAKMKHDVVMTPWDWCYFDHSNRELTIPIVLSWDPSPPADAETLGNHVLGAQACIWTETIPTYAGLEDRLFPRILAMSQNLWTRERESAPNFLARLDGHLNDVYRLSPNMHVSAPETDQDVYETGTLVSFKAPAIKGATVQLSRDGGPWQTMQGPFEIQNEVVRAAIKLPDGRMSDITAVAGANIRPVRVEDPKPGLEYREIAGSFSKVPDFASVTPIATGVVAVPDILGALKENYALQFRGFLKIEKAGIYELTTTSDDGSILRLGGTLVVDNDGPHGAIPQSSRLYLRPGYYPLEVGYYQGTEGASLKVSIEGPGMKHQLLPKEMYFH